MLATEVVLSSSSTEVAPGTTFFFTPRKMFLCCVSGCHNRATSSSKLKFFKIPRGSSPLQTKRRKLWLDAIGEVNGGTEELKGSARVCGAHFTSGKHASLLMSLSAVKHSAEGLVRLSVHC